MSLLYIYWLFQAVWSNFRSTTKWIFYQYCQRLQYVWPHSYYTVVTASLDSNLKIIYPKKDSLLIMETWHLGFQDLNTMGKIPCPFEKWSNNSNCRICLSVYFKFGRFVIYPLLTLRLDLKKESKILHTNQFQAWWWKLYWPHYWHEGKTWL